MTVRGVAGLVAAGLLAVVPVTLVAPWSAVSAGAATDGVTLSVSPVSPIAGETTTMTTTASPALARPAVLQQRDGRRWVAVDRARTDDDGTHAFRRAAVAGDFRVTLPAFVDSATETAYPRAVSATRTVSLARQETFLRLVPRTVEQGTTATVYTESFPKRPGRLVALQRRVDGVWTTIDSGVQTTRGEVRFALATPEAGGIVLRGRVLPADGARGVSSLAHTLTVTPAD